MPRLLVLAPDARGFKRYFASALPQLDVIVPAEDSPESLRALVKEADFILAWRFSSGLLDDAPRLRWIQSFGAGVDHLLTENIPATVAITRIVEAFGPAMAEYVLGYCYATTLDIRRVLEHHRRKQWKPFSPQLLQGRTAVVLGLGSIGREVCRLLRAAGLIVIGVSRTGRPLPEANEAYSVDQLEIVLPRANFLVLVIPLTAATRSLIGSHQLDLLPPEAWLINVARGPIVVEADLLAALQSRRLGGAVLDVFDQEPLQPDHPFWSMPNVIVTPHLAGPDDTRLVAAQFVENYRRLTSGQPLLGLVDRGRGY